MEHPHQIGRYIVREHLGGNMAQVYRAEDPDIGQVVAIKILKPESLADPEVKARFIREARIAAPFQHENVINVYAYGEFEGAPYMVLPFLRGETLKEAIRHRRTGDLRNRVNIALQIARALEYVHSFHVVHRDIKPENVHVGLDGKAKLVDFGIAKSLDMAATEQLLKTSDGFAIGTPFYMAPEQVLGQDVTPFFDIYSYGILLFELLSGSRPRDVASLDQLFQAIIHEPIKLDILEQQQIPAPLRQIVARCTATSPSDRYESFTPIRAELERVQSELASKEISPPSPPVSEPVAGGSNSIKVAVLVVLVLAAVAGIYAAVMRDRRPLEEATATATPAPPREPDARIFTDTGEMILIPAGEFLSGKEQVRERLDPFYIDKTEVTVEAFKKFCVAQNRPVPPHVASAPPGHPVVNITIIDAQDFARWAGKRLPTMKEWERAARGTDGRNYPWGNNHDPARANVADSRSRSGTLVAADAMPDGATADGVLNMAGNAWEFVDERRTPSPRALEVYSRVLSPPPRATDLWYIVMGGSFVEPLIPGVTYEWNSVPAVAYSETTGFRCVKSVE